MRSNPRAALIALALFAAGCGDGGGLFGRHDDSDDSPAKTAPAAPVPRGIPADGPGDLPESDSYLTNLDELVQNLGLNAYYRRGQHGQGLTIAVLDNGFSGLSQSLGKRLPPDVTVATAPLPELQDTTHGTKLAEIVYALGTGRATYAAGLPGPRLLLFNTNGFTDFQAAVAAVISQRVDIVLYAQVWEYGGNFDGGGFINKEVAKATDAGILWINAAGNFGQSTYNGPVARADQAKPDVTLPYQKRYVRFTVPRSGTPVKTVLAWNDFDNSKDYQTPQDLDLILEDANHKEIGAGRLRQSGAAGAQNADFSAHAREIVTSVLNSGLYYLRVEAHSENFDAASRLRLSVDGDGVRVLDGTTDDTVLIPADNPAVLTVGASDVTTSGKEVAAGKPEVAVASAVAFSDGERHTGTSSASAIVAGALAVFEGAYGKLDRAKVVGLIKNGTLSDGAGQGTPVLRLKAL